MAISRKQALTLLKKDKALDDRVDFSERSFRLEERSTLFRLRAEERSNIIDMRKNWSSWILFCIVVIVFFDIVMALLLGFHAITFESPFAIPAFVVDSLVKVLGLAAIIVKFLFGKDSFENIKEGS